MQLRFAVRLATVSLVATGALFQSDQPLAQVTQRQTFTPANAADDPLLRGFRWRSIGPANMSGRVDDIAVAESRPSVIYVGFATGGVWKSVNNGTTWTPIFNDYNTASIGAVAVAANDPNLVWVGTGEPNNRQSSSWGNGIFKSTDGGKTFTNMGLRDTQTMARVAIDPTDPNIVYVAALGHLFGPNAERGLYKTTDGGKTWIQSKFIDKDTGFVDVVMDAKDPRTLYAASYQRRRAVWGFNGGGPGSGIWKTADAGKTWTRLGGNGLPAGPLGRIGLSLSRSQPNIVYAQIETETRGAAAATPAPGSRPGQAGATPAAGSRPGQAGATPAAGSRPGQGARPGATERTPAQPRRGGRQGQEAGAEEEPEATPATGQTAAQTPARGGGQAPAGPPDPKRNGVWRSNDSGRTWQIVSNNNNRPMYYSQIRVDPKNPDIVYTMGAPFYKSTDGGKTFRTVGGFAHGDHHALWINPSDTNHLINGNDGGINVSYDQGETWEHINTMAVGQIYGIAVDMRQPYFVCAGFQDNGSWCGPSRLRSAGPITNADWYRVGGADGMTIQVDPRDHNTVYTTSQNGNVNRLDKRTGRSVGIRPRARPQPRAGQGGPGGGRPGGAAAATRSNIVPEPPAGEQYRFHWTSTVHISPHNSHTIYFGGNRLFKSVNRGDTWTASAELTKKIDRNTLSLMGVRGDRAMHSKNDGTSNYGTITTVAESPLIPGLLWVGTDDGNLQVSRDGGVNWKNVVDKVAGVPARTPVSRVEPSHFEAGTAYVAFDGHENDDLRTYVYVTRDYGATWRPLTANLLIGNANVIREDPKSAHLLYLGTEVGFYVSLDGGGEWKRFMNGLPTVRVEEVLIHPRTNDLILGTHGRSVFILDDVSPLQQLANLSRGEPLLAAAQNGNGQNGNGQNGRENGNQNGHQNGENVAEASPAMLFDVQPGTQWVTDVALSRTVGAAKHFRGENLGAGTYIHYLLKNKVSDEVKITISDASGNVVRRLNGRNEAGFHRVRWNLRVDPPRATQGAGQGRGGPGGGGGGQQGAPAEPGPYLVTLTAGGKELSKRVVVEGDSWAGR